MSIKLMFSSMLLVCVACATAPSVSTSKPKTTPYEAAVGGISDRNSCQQAQDRLSKNQFNGQPEKLELALVQLKCTLAAYNHTQPTSKQKVAVLTQNPDGDHKILFKLVNVHDAEKARDVCNTIAGSYAAKSLAATGDPMYIVAAGGARYSCQAYFEAAVKSDPLLIVFPTLIPGQKLTAEAFTLTVVKGRQLADYIKEHPAALAVPSIAAQGELLKEIGSKIDGSAGEALQNAGNVVNQVIDGASSAVQCLLGGGC